MVELSDYLAAHPKVAVAFSGGVDSAYLLAEATRHCEEVSAYYVRSAFQPHFELEDATRLAEQLDMTLHVLPVDVLACESVRKNPPERCYHCKRLIFETILQAARQDGLPELLDGTNASDSADDRPGMRALEELRVLSPLRACGLTKHDVRKRSRELGLFTWDKPAYACLATRIPTDEPIDERKLLATEAAEDYLRSIGLSDLRVRWFEGAARIQVPATQMPLVIERREDILRELGRTYSDVLLDLEAR